MQTQSKYSHVIWDWNGTLFDDVVWCISRMNEMLGKRRMKLLDSILEYRRAFCFPIINYYKNVGFDLEKESFEILAEEYNSLYRSEQTGMCKLNDNAVFMLDVLHKKKITQVLLSATETSNLRSQLSNFNIIHYFDEILGLSNIYAKSKIDIGYNYMTRKNVMHAVMVGDTEHDFEVANALGIDCLLVAIGHQDKR